MKTKIEKKIINSKKKNLEAEFHVKTKWQSKDPSVTHLLDLSTYFEIFKVREK